VKPGRVAEIARQEVRAGRPVIIWTVFDEEAAIVRDLLADLNPVTVDGSTPEAARPALLASFTEGDAPLLISKAQVGGYGLNLQRAKSMIFSGFDDSQERMYQAVRRAYRFGQTDRVRVFVPYVPELEGLMFENVQAKERRFAAEAAAQEDEYLRVIENERAA
ncbi:MAG TPA: helicase-related protein, partial [Streptosporangiaceae bacterium]|nr:helicase-related protein [Streptosporangiaceae bacterium]